MDALEFGKQVVSFRGKFARLCLDEDLSDLVVIGSMCWMLGEAGVALDKSDFPTKGHYMQYVLNLISSAYDKAKQDDRNAARRKKRKETKNKENDNE